MNAPLFNAEIVPLPDPPKPQGDLYVVVGVYCSGSEWRLIEQSGRQVFATAEYAQKSAEYAHARGWRHVRVYRLSEKGAQ